MAGEVDGSGAIALSMGRILDDARALASHWRPLVGEWLGVRRAPGPVRAPVGSLPDRDAWEAAGFGAFWFGQATTMFRMGGVTVLTDPHFGERSGVSVGGRGTGRVRSTALPAGIADLPPMDVVLLSHAHMDHWEKASLEQLARRETVAVIPRKTRRLLPRGFGGVVEIDWDQAREVEGLDVLALRPRHWGARYVWDIHRGYNAYVLHEGSRRVVFAGDTAETDAFDWLGGDGVDVAAMGIGNYYRPWDRVHATPEQVAAMAARMGARRLMPIHHSTFRDPSEHIDEPMERLARVWDPSRIVCARVGESLLESVEWVPATARD